jgi:O-antigen/teichoic acid export membrane protein
VLLPGNADVAAPPQRCASRRFVRGAATSVAIRIVGALAVFLADLSLARWLGAARFGETTLVFAWLQTLCTLAKGGCEQGSARFVAEYAGTHEWALLAGFRRWRTRWCLTWSLVLSLIALAVLCWLHGEMNATLWMASLLMLALLPIYALTDLYVADLRAVQQVAWAYAPQFLVRPLLAAAIVAALGSLLPANALTAVAIWFWIGVTLCLAVGWKARASLASSPAAPALATELWRQTIAPLAWIAICQMSLGQADVLLVGLLSDPKEAGIYSIAVRISGLVGLGLVCVNAVGAPLLAEQFALQKPAELQRLATTMAWGALLLTLPAAIGALALAPYVLPCFAADFGRAWLPLTLLVASQIVNCLTGSVGQLLAMTGKQRASARVLVVFALLHIVLCVMAVPLWGMLGAALATSMVRIAWNLLLAREVWQQLRINPTVWATLPTFSQE